MKYSKSFIVSCLMLLSCQANSQSNGWAQWTKHPENPVYSSPISTFAAGDPSVLYEKGSYYLYYTDVDMKRNATTLALATSSDGLDWHYQGTILEGTAESWDEALETASIWKEADNAYYLFYAGYASEEFPPVGFKPGDTGLALSDKITTGFKRTTNTPNLVRTLGWYDSDAVFSPDIIKVEETYYLVYAGHCYENCQAPVTPAVAILGATSADLIHWPKHEVPILKADHGRKDFPPQPGIHLFSYQLSNQKRLSPLIL